MLRSLLFVPGDSERKQAKALGHRRGCADSGPGGFGRRGAVAGGAGARSRAAASQPDRATAAAVGARASLSSGLLLEDLVAVFAAALRPASCCPRSPPPPRSCRSITSSRRWRRARAARVGSTQLIVIATETPQAVLNLPTFARRAVGAAHGGGALSGADLGLGGSVGGARGTANSSSRRAHLHVPARALLVPAGGGRPRCAGHRWRACQFPRQPRACSARPPKRAPRWIHRQARHPSRPDRRRSTRRSARPRASWRARGASSPPSRHHREPASSTSRER